MSVRAEFPSLRDYLTETLDPDSRQRIGLITFNQWSFALGAVIETALEAQALGSDVTVGFWADATPLRDTGWTSSRRIAGLLRSATRDQNAESALRHAGLPDRSFARPPITRWRPTEMPAIPDPLTRSRIRELTYHGSDMGRSILQVHPDFNTPIRESHVWPRRWISEAMDSYAWAFDQARALIRERRLGCVVVYNGRFTHDRAVAAAAQVEGARVLYYDTGGYDTDFDLTEATTHDWSHLQGRMQRMWERWPSPERESIGASWFTNRQTHADTNLQVFVAAQTRGHLENLPEAEQLVVYFSSSGDEIAELDLDWEEYLHSQELALAELAAACRARPGTRLVVRTHPHMRLKPADDLEDWMTAVRQAAPDVHFDPSSPVDSYALMARADIVFTYGSTAGIEAAFMGKPVVVMGPSAYDLLGCAQRVTRASELPYVLDHPPVPDPAATLAYGLMMQRRGFTYAHLVKGPDGTPVLEGLPLAEASENVRKASDALLKARTRWLTQA